MELLDGKYASGILLQQIAQRVSALQTSQGIKAHLCAILVGNNGASETYVASKVKHCQQVGMESSLIRFPETISEAELLKAIENVNNNPNIHGLIVQLPLPPHISDDKVTEAISFKKDVDGFHPQNVGRMAKGLPAFISATPLGIIKMLEIYNIETAGKHCVVLGRSHIVGLPISLLMQRNTWPGNATVTICHSQTKDVMQFTRQADILIAALGKPAFVKANMLKPGVVVVDVGITRVPDESKKSGFRIQGDVDFNSVAPIASFISPVPGGVGLLTIAALLENTMLAAEGQIYG
jgi:methylenetetrahydrofolate dehydrogenase (NADP+) / methenyltetrahydrofolate cyclohydrolase